MNEIIERAGKAMYVALGGGDPEATKWDDLRSKDREGFCDQARAAIESIREPSIFMIEAEPDDYVGPYNKCNSSAYAKAFWQAMIDAALR